MKDAQFDWRGGSSPSTQGTRGQGKWQDCSRKNSDNFVQVRLVVSNCFKGVCKWRWLFRHDKDPPGRNCAIDTLDVPASEKVRLQEDLEHLILRVDERIPAVSPELG